MDPSDHPISVMNKYPSFISMIFSSIIGLITTFIIPQLFLELDFKEKIILFEFALIIILIINLIVSFLKSTEMEMALRYTKALTDISLRESNQILQHSEWMNKQTELSNQRFENEINKMLKEFEKNASKKHK